MGIVAPVSVASKCASTASTLAVWPIVASGLLSEDSVVDPNARFYHAVLVDKDGKRIQRRDGHNIHTSVYTRTIGPGTSDVARYRFTVPDSMRGKKLTLRASLHWRKFDRAYTEFAYRANPEGFKAFNEVPELPINEIDTDTVILPVGEVVSGGLRAKSEDWERFNDYGIGLLLQGDTRNAAIAFDAVAQVDPKRIDGHRNLARIAVRDGNISEAYRHLERCEEIAPGDPEWSICEEPSSVMGIEVPAPAIDGIAIRSVDPLPLEKRIGGTFLWQMDPWMVKREYGGIGMETQWPGSGLFTAYWVGRRDGVITEGSGYAATFATDGDETTRWGSAFADAQWLQVRLTAPHVLHSISVLWEEARPEGYRVQVPAPGADASWAEIAAVKRIHAAAFPAWVTTPLPPGTVAATVRLYAPRRATEFGVSCFTFRVCGAPIGPPRPQAPPPPWWTPNAPPPPWWVPRPRPVFAARWQAGARARSAACGHWASGARARWGCRATRGAGGRGGGGTASPGCSGGGGE